MPRVRTFIALDPGKAIRDRRIALQEDFAELVPDVKWVERNQLDMLLKEKRLRAAFTPC